MTPNVKGALLMMAAMAAFTFNDTFMKSLSDELHLFQAIFLRGVATTLLLLAMAIWFRGFNLRLSRRDWGLITLRTLCEIAAAYLFITALFNMPIATLTAILQALPLTVALAGALFLNEPIGWRRLSAIAVGFVGVLMIVKPGGADFSVYSLLALASVIAVAVRDLAARKLSSEVPSLTVALVGAAGVTLAAGLASIGQSWTMPSQLGVAQLGGAILFIIGGYVASVMTMRVGDLGAIAPFRYAGLLWAILLGILVFDEWPDTWTLLGSAIVVATGVFTLLRERALGKRATPMGPRIR